jgi:hypothetical protein
LKDFEMTLTPILITLVDGILDTSRVVIAEDGEHLEKLFTKECEDYGHSPFDEEYDNGYAELEDATIYMSWGVRAIDING